MDSVLVTPAPRRRSAFFEKRRSLGVTNVESSEVNEEEFINLLTAEKKGWIKLHHEKIAERKLARSTKEPITIDILTNEQREYLLQKPNVNNIMEKCNQLEQIRNDNIKIFNKHVQKDEKKCDILEEHMQNITEDLILQLT